MNTTPEHIHAALNHIPLFAAACPAGLCDSQ